MPTAASDKDKPNSLLVSEASANDNSVIALSARTMQALSLFRGDTVLVQGRLRKDTVLIVLDDSDLDDRQARINRTVRRNLHVSLGDSIRVFPCPDIKYAVRVGVAPIADTINGFSGSLFETFLAPYFREAYRPVRQGDFFNCRDGGREIEFKVVAVEQPEYGIVSGDTVIHSEGHAIQRESEDSAQYTTYEDIGGYQRQLDDIHEIVDLPLQYPELFSSIGIKPLGGILLHGPSGVGKTYIARTLANETGAFFFLINGPELLSGEPGKSESNLRLAFSEAETKAPSILFIDELDSFASKRDKATDAVERRLVSQLMTLMDGLKVRSNVLVIAASNRPHAIDPSLRRHGRFDREIEIGLPDLTSRRQILAIHTKRMKLAGDVDLDAIAAGTEGYVGADIAAVCAGAAMRQVREKVSLIDSDRKGIEPEVLNSLQVTADNFNDAIKATKPSAWRESAVVDRTEHQ